MAVPSKFPRPSCDSNSLKCKIMALTYVYCYDFLIVFCEWAGKGYTESRHGMRLSSKILSEEGDE